MSKRVIVIGSGFSGLSAATHLSHFGYNVTILEKNNQAGGRARVFSKDGFVFDMGPSWYWMPDVFEDYFGFFGKKPSDYYELVRLDPSYSVWFGEGESERLNIPASMTEFEAMCENLQPGSSKGLREFLDQASYKYKVGIHDLVHRPGRSLTEYIDPKLWLDVLRLDVFTSMSKHVGRYFKHPKLVSLMEFPVLFLGATAQKIPALYSLMNYADIALGTWYPKGGMHKIVEGMVSLAEEKGVEIRLGEEVKSFTYKAGKIVGVVTNTGTYAADIIINSADYHHIDSKVLDEEYRNYSKEYWDKRVMAPSSLLYYVGLDKKLSNVLHHNLFFDEDLNDHAREIYEQPKWPTKPLFYASVPSITDSSVAPSGKENLFFLIPTAPGLSNNEEVQERYFELIVSRFEKLTGNSIKDSIVYKRAYGYSNFVQDYHAFKGNAYGLANTLTQTAILKPSLKSKKLKNLYHTGQLTVPGPGVPPSLISGRVVAKEVQKEYPVR
jgi:phytoene desaturase